MAAFRAAALTALLLAGGLHSVVAQTPLPEPSWFQRQLIIGGTSEGPAVQADFSGVVMLNITARGVQCTGTLIAPSVLLTAPACFQATEAPITASTDWDGKILPLSPYEIISFVNDVPITIGHAFSHAYVYASGQEGYRLSMVNFTLTPAGVALNATTYPFWTGELAPPLSVQVAGFGPLNTTVVNFVPVPIVSGVLRAANQTLTSIGQSIKRIGTCSGFRIGGNIFLDKVPRLEATYVRMCGQFGDMGSPMLYPHVNTSRTYIIGVMQDVDVYPCALRKAIYTSTSFRQDWIRMRLLNFTGVAVQPEICPSYSPTPTSTTTLTATPTPSASQNVTIVPPPPPPPEPFPWWKVVVFVVGVGVPVSAAAFLLYRARRRFFQLRRVKPFDAKDMARPHVEHVVSDLVIDDPQLVTPGAHAGLGAGNGAGTAAGLKRRTDFKMPRLSEQGAEELVVDLERKLRKNQARVLAASYRSHAAEAAAAAAAGGVATGDTRPPPPRRRPADEYATRQEDYLNSSAVLRPRFNPTPPMPRTVITGHIPTVLLQPMAVQPNRFDDGIDDDDAEDEFGDRRRGGSGDDDPTSATVTGDGSGGPGLLALEDGSATFAPRTGGGGGGGGAAGGAGGVGSPLATSTTAATTAAAIGGSPLHLPAPSSTRRAALPSGSGTAGFIRPHGTPLSSSAKPTVRTFSSRLVADVLHLSPRADDVDGGGSPRTLQASPRAGSTSPRASTVLGVLAATSQPPLVQPVSIRIAAAAGNASASAMSRLQEEGAVDDDRDDDDDGEAVTTAAPAATMTSSPSAVPVDVRAAAHHHRGSLDGGDSSPVSNPLAEIDAAGSAPG